MKLKPINKKIIIIFLILAFLPFEHGCFEVSFGFPAVAIVSWNFFDFSKYIPLGFLINILFAISAVLIANHFYKKEYFSNPYFKYAMLGLLFYNLFYGVYFILYFNAHNFIKSIYENIYFILYPVILFYKGTFFQFTIKPIFPVENDFQYRIFYVISCVFYSLIGLIIAVIKEKLKKLKKHTNS